jgi:hypothetical protein
VEAARRALTPEDGRRPPAGPKGPLPDAQRRWRAADPPAAPRASRWDPSVEARARQLYDALVAQKQDMPPGSLLEHWNRHILFQLPETFANLDLTGKLIYLALKVMYVLAMIKLVLTGRRNKYSYAAIDRFVQDRSARGNPVFGDRSQERAGGHHLTEAQRCAYNRHGLVDSFRLSSAVRARYPRMADDTIRFSERTGIAYTVGAHLYHADLVSLASERNLHCAGPNASGRYRCSVALRYAKGDVLIDDRRHLAAVKRHGPKRVPGLDGILTALVEGKMNAVIQVAGDPEESRRAGNNVLCPDELKRRIAQCGLA